MTALPLQIHETSDPDWDGIPDPGWTPAEPMFLKPRGFWTSSAMEGGMSDWKRWNEATPDDRLDRAYEVAGEPRILVLRDDAGLLRAMEETGSVRHGGGVASCDFEAFWRAVAERWDAVHVPADRDRRSLIASWDCESTVWFRPHLHLALAPVPRPEAVLRTSVRVGDDGADGVLRASC